MGEIRGSEAQDEGGIHLKTAPQESRGCDRLTGPLYAKRVLAGQEGGLGCGCGSSVCETPSKVKRLIFAAARKGRTEPPAKL